MPTFAGKTRHNTLTATTKVARITRKNILGARIVRNVAWQSFQCHHCLQPVHLFPNQTARLGSGAWEARSRKLECHNCERESIAHRAYNSPPCATNNSVMLLRSNMLISAKGQKSYTYCMYVYTHDVLDTCKASGLENIVQAARAHVAVIPTNLQNEICRHLLALAPFLLNLHIIWSSLLAKYFWKESWIAHTYNFMVMAIEMSNISTVESPLFERWGVCVATGWNVHP